ncbi:M56 family metallopeptidase [Hymenobacter sp. BT175]|uniref:M56 family metallopeptidase n=1 Tax=Hymenobacter translucens TaxID=2886507 RepID=UPI001D0E7021|nr:M56 family metallopeptidase [Hymenobacter translucens]MCC2545970.1 M56 family metallopeptidase [Hymenobacter translucens]
MLTLTLPTLINWWWQSCLILGSAWLLYRLALRSEPTFRYNRQFLRWTPLLALVLPPLLTLATPWLQAWLPARESTPALLRPSVLLPAVTAGSSGAGGIDLLPWLLGLYLAGALLVLGRLGWQLCRLWQRTRRLPGKPGPGYELVCTAGKLPISSFGSRVFWDETAALTPAEAQLILAHEAAHVVQRHSRDRLGLELLRSLLWLNPFVHLYPRALELTHEYLADEAALGEAPTPEAASAYSALLARLTLQRFAIDFPLVHSFTYSQTLTRIAMLKTSHPARRWKHWLPLPAATALLLTLAACTDIDSIGPPPLPPPPPPAPMAPPPPPPPLVGVKQEKVYDKVDQMPEYPGGQAKLMQDIMANLKYPADAKAAGLGGTVLIEFVINSEGQISVIDFKQRAKAPAGQEALARLLDKAATDAILVGVSGTGWKPGRHQGKAVAVSFVVPLSFQP